MKIITISREFGSGGRELGKRMADVLGWDYYDREIISAIAEKTDLTEEYVENVLNSQAWQSIPLTFGHSFAAFLHRRRCSRRSTWSAFRSREGF